mgnify:FL=1
MKATSISIQFSGLVFKVKPKIRKPIVSPKEENSYVNFVQIKSTIKAQISIEFAAAIL